MPARKSASAVTVSSVRQILSAQYPESCSVTFIAAELDSSASTIKRRLAEMVASADVVKESGPFGGYRLASVVGHSANAVVAAAEAPAPAKTGNVRWAEGTLEQAAALRSAGTSWKEIGAKLSVKSTGLLSKRVRDAGLLVAA